MEPRRVYLWVGVACIVLALTAGPAVLLPRSSLATSADFSIMLGKGIGPVMLGMTGSDLRKVAKGGTATTQGGQRVVTFAAEGLSVWVSGNRVVRVQTTNPHHRTAGGYWGPGPSNVDLAIMSLCRGLFSAAARDGLEGSEITCPFVGVMLEVAKSRITSISVVPAVSLVR